MTSFAFIKHADFIIRPFEQYLTDFLFVWSARNSGPSPDGVIRLPFRIPFILSNWLVGQEVTAYLYILFIFVFSFAAMYLFVRTFFSNFSRLSAALASLFFAVNPIFLGNTAKIGLQMGVACLPLLLVCAHRYFKNPSIRWTILILLLVLASFVHPFTLFINISVLAAYLAFNAKRIRVRHILTGIVLGAGLGAYIWMPLYSIGSVGKTQPEVAQNQQANLSGLVDVAHTDGLVEGFSLSKSVLVDFDFFTDRSYPLYILSVCLLYGFIMIAMVSRQNGLRHRKPFAISLTALIALITLANVSGNVVRSAMIYIIQTPVGWAIRSPLKWQLFIPFALSILIAISIGVYRKEHQRILAILAIPIFVGLNGVIAVDVFHKLVQPKEVTTFSQFAQEDMTGKRTLFMRNFECGQILSEDHAVNSELDYILQTGGGQTTYTNQTDIAGVRVGDFDYVLDCTNYAFEGQESWSQIPTATDIVNIYSTGPKDQSPIETIGYGWAHGSFTADTFHSIINKTDDAKVLLLDDASYANGEVHELVNDVRKSNFSPGFITSQVTVQQDYQSIRLFSGRNVDGEKIVVNKNDIELRQTNLTATNIDSNARAIPVSESYDISYVNPEYDFTNLIDNPSFEQGLWRQVVGDCYNFDSQPDIDMGISTDAYDGVNALRLTARRHIACTYPAKATPVRPGQNVFVSFKAKVIEGTGYSYALKFNDKDQSSLDKVVKVPAGGEWQEHASFITVPSGATSMTLYVYASPTTQGLEGTTVLYDDFFVTLVPDIANKLYIAASDATQQPNLISNAVKHNSVTYTAQLNAQPNVTETYLVLKEKFHDGWSLRIDGQPPKPGIVAGHLADANGYNVWRLSDLATLQDNTILTIAFTPQRSFYIGAIVSTATLLGIATYIATDAVSKRKSMRAIKAHNKDYHVNAR